MRMAIITGDLGYSPRSIEHMIQDTVKFFRDIGVIN
tara:strand:+ start:1123 stop:1230 length:108 start_codon:yes stop_codon:yes gene_type:complete